MGLRLTAHQPAYIPWLGLLAKIADADLFCFFDGVPMESSGHENRQRIKTHAGEQWLTVPVRRDHTRPLYDVEIANDQGWRRKHWRSIQMAYAKAPFFENYASGFVDILDQNHGGLANLDLDVTRWLMQCFGITTPIVRASNYQFAGAKSALVLDMCRQLEATEYVFGALGRDYADLPAFQAAGIKVEFQNYRHPEYPQLHGSFAPYMGAIDLLFNVGGQRGLEVLTGRAR